MDNRKHQLAALEMADLRSGNELSMDRKKFYLFTIGCKVNQYETQAIKEYLSDLGLVGVSGAGDADLVLINSCAVTSKAVQDLRKITRRFLRENTRALLVVTGCAVSGHLESELDSLLSVDRLVPVRDISSLRGVLIRSGLLDGDRNAGSGPARQVGAAPWQLGISDFPRARPVLKVQDGCSRFCTYCIVPYTRGGPRSRPLDDILSEVRTLAESGFQELVVSGINLGQFSLQHRNALKDSYDFWDLVRDLDSYLQLHFGDRVRLRLSSLEPTLLNDKGVETLTSCQQVCPHLHLSLQSASPKILRKMGRDPDSPVRIERFLGKLQKKWGLFALGADVLLGFPGEDDQDFLQTRSFLQDQAFTYGHVFSYSPRPGTRAAEMSGQVPGDVKKRRSLVLRNLLRGKKEAFTAELLSLQRQEIVLEETSPALGLNQYYVLCVFKGDFSEMTRGQIVQAVPRQAVPDGLLCEPVFVQGK